MNSIQFFDSFIFLYFQTVKTPLWVVALVVLLLSVIISTRADNFGGLQHFRLYLLLNFCDRVLNSFLIKDSWELILIDANPGLLCPPLRSLIREPFASRPWLRILEKSEFSDSIFNEDFFPLHESLNFGIQNSLGKFTLITNFDVFISESILQELCFGNLENDAFYLADRLDATLAIDQGFSFLENKITPLNWSLESSAKGELHVRHEVNFMPFSFLPIRYALDPTAGLRTYMGVG